MDDDEWRRVSARVKARRLDAVRWLGRKLTQQEAAKTAGISDTTWGKIENGPAGATTPENRAGACVALRWTTDSIDRILSGEEPQEVAGPSASEADTATLIDRAVDLLSEASQRLRGEPR